MEKRITINVLGKDNIISSINFLSKYWDERKFDVLAKALKYLNQEIQTLKKESEVRNYQITEN